MFKKVGVFLAAVVIALAMATPAPASAAGMTLVLSIWNGSSWLTLGDVVGDSITLNGGSKYRFVLSGTGAPYDRTLMNVENGQSNWTLWSLTSFTNNCSGSCSTTYLYPQYIRVAGAGDANNINSTTFIGTVIDECAAGQMVTNVAKDGVQAGPQATNYEIDC